MKVGNYNVSFGSIRKIENQVKNKSEREILITKIIERQLFRINADVGDWRSALTLAESITNPSNAELIRVYNEVILDAHLKSVMEQRILKVLSKKYMVVDSKGETDPINTALLKSSWFINTLRLFMEARFYGSSLIQYGELEKGIFNFIKLFPRQNVEPKTKVVKTEHYLTSGISFEEEPYKDWIFFVEHETHGLLNQASPLVLWKRGALNSWSDFAEVFGIPPRIGRTDVKDKELLSAMTNSMKTMGKLSYAVIDHDDSFDLLESAKTDSFNVFLKLAEYADSQMSKLILGQTGTTDEKAFAGSAGVHERIGNEITQSDCMWIEAIMNEQFFPFLINLGFKLEGKNWKFDTKEQFTKEKQFDITEKLLQHYDIPEEWINDTFNVPVSKKLDTAVAPTIKNDTNILAKLKNSVEGFYLDFPYNQEEENIFTEEEQFVIMSGIYAGTITSENLSFSMYDTISGELIKNVNRGFGQVDTSGNEAIISLLKDFQENTYVFSGAKTHEQTKALSALVFDSDGRKVPFSQFKKEAEEILDTFNKNWLQAEQRTAIAQANAGRDWERIQDQKGTLPNLKYTTAGDNRVRAEHNDLDGIVRPVDDSFWADNYPPNGWRCRCDVDQLASGTVTPLSEMVKMRNVEPISELFRMNAGIDRVVFPLEHPYFKGATKEQLETNFGFGIPEQITV